VLGPGERLPANIRSIDLVVAEADALLAVLAGLDHRAE
jgi:hypothetical protein